MAERRTPEETSAESPFDKAWKSTVTNFVNLKSEPNTINAYRSDLKQLKQYFDERQVTDWRQVDREVIESYFQYLSSRFAPSSMYRKAGVIGTFLSKMIKHKYPIPEEATRGIPSQNPQEIRKIKAEIEPLSQEDFNALISHISYAQSRRDRALLHLLRSGADSAQIVKGKITHIIRNPKDKSYPINIDIQKRDKHDRPILIKLDAAAASALTEYLQEWGQLDRNHPLIPNRYKPDQPITRAGIWIMVNNIAK